MNNNYKHIYIYTYTHIHISKQTNKTNKTKAQLLSIQKNTK